MAVFDSDGTVFVFVPDHLLSVRPRGKSPGFTLSEVAVERERHGKQIKREMVFI